MKITVYTIPDCQFSKQEKEYLNANNLQFEEKNLETNKEFLTEMLAISNNFAGTPVTRVEKDDGTIAVLKGFTKEEFDTTFGFTATPAVDSAKEVVVPQTTETPPKVEGTAPAERVAPVEIGSVIPPITDSPPTITAPTPNEPPIVTTADPLKSVMDNLQTQSQTPPVETTIPPAPPVADQPIQPFDSAQGNSPTPPANLPNIPEPDFK